MKFLNPKEQVIDIQLTQFGKHLLSKGEFKPTYYAFFDDDILYDSQYGDGLLEIQNDTETRIKEETPRMEVQYVYSGIDTNIRKNLKIKRTEKSDVYIPPLVDQHYSLSMPLGNSSLGNEYSPAVSLKFLEGEISSSLYYNMTGSHCIQKIPQLDTIVSFETTIGFSEDSLNDLPYDDGGVRNFEDGSYIKVKDDFLLIEIEELNTNFERENFDIEVYKIENIDNAQSKFSSGSINLIPLFFSKKKKYDTYILKEEEVKEQIKEIEPVYVEYYFDVLTDTEIDEEILCKYKKENRKNIFTDSVFTCKDIGSSKGGAYGTGTKIKKDVYETDISEYKDEDEECK